MITADIHIHTAYSHGKNSPEEMLNGAIEKGLDLIGFSEHSPRPNGYDYSHEYREKLSAHLEDYLREVSELKTNNLGCKVLLGMEMDWLPNEQDFIKAACARADFDYFLGSVHFLDTWGFDDSAEVWSEASQSQCEKLYRQYFSIWENMLASGLFQVAAHPDLIKIFSVDRFHIWLEKAAARSQISHCLNILRKMGMSMEISSAGLRKPCAEIYPCPDIMRIAAAVGVPVSFASDAHMAGDIAFAFPTLAAYARSFGFGEYVYFDHGAVIARPI